MIMKATWCKQGSLPVAFASPAAAHQASTEDLGSKQGGAMLERADVCRESTKSSGACNEEVHSGGGSNYLEAVEEWHCPIA
jgi:hypothetical protein